MPVLPEITAQTDILFIGWNPGEVEVRQRRPFVGPSGKLLRGWAKRLGIVGRVGYANVCLYRPPDGNRKPTKPEILGCAGILTKLIERVKPKLVVCLGDVGAHRFGFKGSLGQMVGRFKIETGLPEAGPFLVTVLYHPAYAVRLKGSKRFAEVEAQTLEVMQEALYRIGGDRKVERYDFLKVPAIVLLSGPTALDTEHVGDPDARVCKLTTIQTYDGRGKVLIGPSVLAGNHHPFIFHNAIHDLIVLARHGMSQQKVVGDTQVAAWMLGRQNLSLKGLAWRELGAAVMDWEEAVASEDEAVWDNYCAQDPVLTWRLHEKLYAELQSKGIAWLYDNVEMPLQPILAEASMTGMMVDHQKVLSLWGTMERRMEVLERHLKDIAGEDYNPNSPEQTLAVIKSRGFRVTSTDAKELAKLPHDEFIMFLLSYRKCQGRISRYCRPLSQLSVVTGMFDPCGTGTGRLSQRKRNLQNFPFDVKECLQARPGYVFVYRDYSQIEVRLAAFLSRDEYLLTALHEGRNVHEELCIAVFGYRVPELYTKSKSANFERLYGGSVETRADALGVAPTLLRRVEIGWPGFEAWAAAQRREARVSGVARTFMGRQMVLTGIESSDPYLRDKAEREAINMPEQGGAADICKFAMVKAQVYMKQLNGRVAHQEHDSILAEVPISYAQDADQALDEAMTAAVPQEIRDVVAIPSKSVISTHWG